MPNRASQPAQKQRAHRAQASTSWYPLVRGHSDSRRQSGRQQHAPHLAVLCSSRNSVPCARSLHGPHQTAPQEGTQADGWLARHRAPCVRPSWEPRACDPAPHNPRPSPHAHAACHTKRQNRGRAANLSPHLGRCPPSTCLRSRCLPPCNVRMFGRPVPLQSHVGPIYWGHACALIQSPCPPRWQAAQHTSGAARALRCHAQHGTARSLMRSCASHG